MNISNLTCRALISSLRAFISFSRLSCIALLFTCEMNYYKGCTVWGEITSNSASYRIVHKSELQISYPFPFILRAHILVPLCTAAVAPHASELTLEIWSHGLPLVPCCEKQPHPARIEIRRGNHWQRSLEGRIRCTSLFVNSCFSFSNCSTCSSLSDLIVCTKH